MNCKLGAKKLIRLEQTLIEEIEELIKSQKEYITFTGMVRKLIRIGLDNIKHD